MSYQHGIILVSSLIFSAEVLNITLSLYIADRNQPLPQSDEVLMCTSNTTKDEVCDLALLNVIDRVIPFYRSVLKRKLSCRFSFIIVFVFKVFLLK